MALSVGRSSASALWETNDGMSNGMFLNSEFVVN
jgi:hypothetical protein